MEGPAGLGAGTAGRRAGAGGARGPRAVGAGLAGHVGVTKGRGARSGVSAGNARVTGRTAAGEPCGVSRLGWACPGPPRGV